ncbi:hypothetical protein [Rhodococcoides fascians]|nr:hypothetical protein [Rhodococcus fascians]CAH0209771.1 hypothetical protein SRABI91_02121 [Rhodococcus fascians]
MLYLCKPLEVLEVQDAAAVVPPNAASVTMAGERTIGIDAASGSSA